MNVQRTGAAGLMTLAVMLGFVATVRAHHGSFISYDRDKQWTTQATVTEFRYVNPHAQLFFETKDKDGKVVQWSGEMLPNPAQLIAAGWSRRRANEALAPGTVVNVTALPAKAGGNAVLVTRVTNVKGEELLGAGPAAGAPAAPAK